MSVVETDPRFLANIYTNMFIFRIDYLEALENKREESRRKGSLVEVSRYIALRGIVPKSLLLRRFTKNAVRNTLYYLRLVDAVITSDKYVVSTPLVILLEKRTGELWPAVLGVVAREAYSEEKSILLKESRKIIKSMNKVRNSHWKVLVDDLDFDAQIEEYRNSIDMELEKLCPLISGKRPKECMDLLYYASWLLGLAVSLTVWAAMIQVQIDNTPDFIKNQLESYIKEMCPEKKEESNRKNESSNFDLECMSLKTFLKIYRNTKQFYKKLKKDSFSYIHEQCMKVIDKKIKGEQGKYNARSVIRSFLESTWEFFTS